MVSSDYTVLMDNATVTGLFAGISAFMFATSHHTFNKLNTKEILCRTGTRLTTPEENSMLHYKVSQSGLNIDPLWVQGLRVILASSVMLISLLLTMLFSARFLLLVFFTPLLYYLPILYLNRKIKERQMQIKLTLSKFTMLLSTALTAGADLQTGVRVSADAIRGPLKDVINDVLKAYGSGQPFSEALIKTTEKVEVDELMPLVQTLSQIYDKGAPVSETMKAYSRQIRTTKRHTTRERAGKLSVSMLFPIAIFMLMPFLIVIMFPAAYVLTNSFLNM